MRSLLFVPADSKQKRDKAFAGPADVVILDLEDGIGPDGERKAAARALVRELPVHLARARTFVRINPLNSPWCDEDIDAAVTAGAAGVVLPKCEGVTDVEALARRLDQVEQRRGSAEVTQILAIATETARGVQKLREFVEPVPRLKGLMWGAEDLCADLGGSENRDATGRYLPVYQAARDGCLVAARAAGALAIDAVVVDFRDLHALQAECAEARTLGFDGKAAIHPAQVEVIAEAFAPSAKERLWAEQVVAAFAGSTAATSLEGRMLDLPHLKRAQRILGVDSTS